ncbi:MAG: hypothetical protein JEY99_19500 [Spirochaetales bacterium]|nr:hypothetical protein [Spirochaetales bacterium]
MLKVNGRDMEWFDGISFSNILQEVGYTISKPRIMIRVNGIGIPKKERDSYKIMDGSDILIINTLCGG